MGEAMNYDGYAARYRKNRFAVEWNLNPLAEICQSLAPGSRVMDVGCGTGNYVIALWQRFHKLRFFGLDVSQGMLEQAAARVSDAQLGEDQTAIEWCQGNAEEHLPYPDDFASLVLAVDVVHHLERQAVLFSEGARVLLPGSLLVLASDSPEDLLARSLTRYFPETLEREQRRYPTPDVLDGLARDAGFRVLPRLHTHGELELTPGFVQKIEDRCASALRLLDDEAHAAGVRRVREAAARGERWQSHYTVYRYRKPESPEG